MQAPESHPTGPVIVPFPAHLAAEPPIVMEFKDGPVELSQGTSNQIRAICRETGETEQAVFDRVIIHISRTIREEHPKASETELARLTVEKFSNLCQKDPQPPKSSPIG